MTATAKTLNDGNDLAMKHLKGPGFAALYGSVMAFVEETTAYLDGPGRAASKALDRLLAHDYASLTRQLTMSAMQVANIMLTLRAVKIGETPLTQGLLELTRKYRGDTPSARLDFRSDASGLPDGILDLVLKCEELRLSVDQFINSLESAQEPIENPVHSALARLGEAFSK